MRTIGHEALGVLTLFHFAACSHIAAPKNSAPRLTAHVTGALIVDIDAPAFFLIGPATTDPSRKDFLFFASTTDDSTAKESVLITRFRGRPPVGRYAVVSPAQTLATLAGVQVLLFVEPAGQQQYFAAESGSIEILTSTSDRVTGVLNVQARRYCSRVGGLLEGSCDPRLIPQGAPSVTIHGNFVALSKPLGG